MTRGAMLRIYLHFTLDKHSATRHIRTMSAFFRNLCLLLAALTLPLNAQAGLIRDAEVENTLHLYAAPIFQAAGIQPDDVRIFIVANPELNAYVAGGLNMFLHTGIIEAATKPGMLIGVMAHETGHISGAHLSQLREKSTRAMVGSVLGAIVGAAVIAGGGHQAGAGVIMGTQSMAQRGFMTDIRINEESADQAALTFLDACDISATGMLEMFETLRRAEGPSLGRDRFMSDHPLTTERIATMRNHIAESRIPADQVPDGFAEMHARMVAKLIAFTAPYDVTMKRYPTSDTSVAARYARAIAAFKNSDLATALAGMNSLLKQYPKDPYFYDTKGQILFENGKLPEAAAAYAKASTLNPNSALILTEYAKVIIAQKNREEIPRAIALLERSKTLDDSYDVTWRQLALAYAAQGKVGLSYAALAEEAALNGDEKAVFQHVARARPDAANDPTLALQLDDLEREAKTLLEAKKSNGSSF